VLSITFCTSNSLRLAFCVPALWRNGTYFVWCCLFAPHALVSAPALDIVQTLACCVCARPPRRARSASSAAFPPSISRVACPLIDIHTDSSCYFGTPRSRRLASANVIGTPTKVYGEMSARARSSVCDGRERRVCRRVRARSRARRLACFRSAAGTCNRAARGASDCVMHLR
jgi:hypothetical protein